MGILMEFISSFLWNVSMAISRVLGRRRDSSTASDDEEQQTLLDTRPPEDARRDAKLNITSASHDTLTLLQLASPTSKELDVDAIENFVKLNPDSVYDADPKGHYTVLHRAIKFVKENDDSVSKSHKELLLFLIKHNASVNARNVRFETPLHVAARSNKYKTIKLLLRNGASINAEDIDNNTCLHVAVENRCVETVATLHCYADRLNENWKNKQDLTALELAKQVEFNDHKEEMKKISTILEYPLKEYKEKEIHKEYLKEESSDSDWSLQPQYHIKAVQGANVIIGRNTINLPDRMPLRAPDILSLPGDRLAIEQGNHS